MQTLEERNTSTQIDAPQVHRICDLVLNKDLSQHLSVKAGRYCNQETDRDLSVRDLKTSSNSPKWTNSEMKGQNSRVSVKSKSKLSKKSILTWIYSSENLNTIAGSSILHYVHISVIRLSDGETPA